MQVHLNGQKKELESSLTLQEILDKFQIPTQAIAVALNSEVVPHSRFHDTFPHEGDRIEIVRAVGGG